MVDLRRDHYSDGRVRTVERAYSYATLEGDELVFRAPRSGGGRTASRNRRGAVPDLRKVSSGWASRSAGCKGPLPFCIAATCWRSSALRPPISAGYPIQGSAVTPLLLRNSIAFISPM